MGVKRLTGLDLTGSHRIAELEAKIAELFAVLGQAESERDRLLRGAFIPAFPRILGERLSGVHILWAGPCHIEALANFAPQVGCTAEQLLFTSHPHEEIKPFDASPYDAIVVGLNLTNILGIADRKSVV